MPTSSRCRKFQKASTPARKPRSRRHSAHGRTFFGVKIDKLGEIQAYEAISETRRGHVHTGHRAQSNFEMQGFLKQVPTLSKTPEGNAIINRHDGSYLLRDPSASIANCDAGCPPKNLGGGRNRNRSAICLIRSRHGRRAGKGKHRRRAVRVAVLLLLLAYIQPGNGQI